MRASWERGRPAHTKSGTASAISPTLDQRSQNDAADTPLIVTHGTRRLPPSGSTAGSALSPTPPQGGSDTGAPYASLISLPPLRGSRRSRAARRRLMRWGGSSWSFLPLGGNLFSLSVFLRGPSWICFCLFAFRGNLLPPSRPLANPSRAPANPFVALRRPSWPFVDMFLPFRLSWICFCLFAFRGNLFAFSPFVDIFFGRRGKPLNWFQTRLSPRQRPAPASLPKR